MSERLEFLRNYEENGFPCRAVTILELKPTSSLAKEITIERGTLITVSREVGFFTASSVTLQDPSNPQRVLAIAASYGSIGNIDLGGLDKDVPSGALGSYDFGFTVHIKNVEPGMGGSDEHTSPYDATGGLTPGKIKQMVIRFAPVLNFHEDETFFPVGHWRMIKSGHTHLYMDIDTGSDNCKIETFSQLGDELGENTFITNSKWTDDSRETPNRERALEAFPLQSTESGPNAPDYPIVVDAEFKLLFEALHQNTRALIDYLYELMTNQELKSMSILGSGSKRADGLFDHIRFDPMFWKEPEKLHHQELYYLLMLCEGKASENENDIPYALGWLETEDIMKQKQWDVVRDYALISYYLIYPFNDFCYHGGINVHEGDIEGLGVFVTLKEIDKYRNDEVSVDDMSAEGVTTIGHGASDGVDTFAYWKNRVDARTVRIGNPENKTFDVFIARGSHATYLTDGPHDLSKWPELAETIEPVAIPAAAAILCGFLPFLCPPIITGLSSLPAITEKVNEMLEDHCSEEGLSAGTEDAIGTQSGIQINNIFHCKSSIDLALNVYMRENTLALRIFPGHLGARVQGEDDDRVAQVEEVAKELLLGGACIEESASTFNGRMNRFIKIFADVLHG